MPDERDWTRREILRTAAAGSLASSVYSQVAFAQDKNAADPERIRRENDMPGTRDWMTTNVRIDPKTKYRCPWIEGYASRTSVRPGESITLHVSTNPASPFLIDVYRLGYYQGPYDGVNSPALSLAIAAYQRDQGMPSTGTLDGTVIQRLSAAAQ